jgi:hypothetical protein
MSKHWLSKVNPDMVNALALRFVDSQHEHQLDWKMSFIWQEVG